MQLRQSHCLTGSHMHKVGFQRRNTYSACPLVFFEQAQVILQSLTLSFPIVVDMEIILASIALLPPLVHCGNKIRKAVKEIQSSRRDIFELTDETVIFSDLCGEYLRACADDHEAHSRRSSSIQHLETWIRKLLGSLNNVLQKVGALKRGRKHRSSVEDRIIAYIEWYLSKSAVKRLRASMAVARETIKGSSNIMCIQKLDEELRMLKEALVSSPLRRREIEKRLGMTIEKKIESINQAL